MSDLKLDVDQAGELKAAFRREGPWTNEEIKMLCERKGFLTKVRQALLNLAEIKPVEMFSNAITRIVTVNRALTPQEMLNATGRKQYINPDAVKGMPRGEGKKAKVTFFKPDPSAYENSWISDDNLEKEFEKRGLKPVDPYSLAKVNQDDPSFADNHPNCTYWRGADGKWHYAAFGRGDDERCVSVRRGGSGWCDGWWFAGSQV